MLIGTLKNFGVKVLVIFCVLFVVPVMCTRSLKKKDVSTETVSNEIANNGTEAENKEDLGNWRFSLSILL